MRIGLLGTRGIPNRYGGFEEFAEHVSKVWINQGHEVYVYCDDDFESVRLELERLHQVFMSSRILGKRSQMVYDYRCTRDAVLRDLDIVYHAGYATSVLGNLMFYYRIRNKLVYNLDGLEWRRTKFNIWSRLLIKSLERIAVSTCNHLVADNIGIANYILDVYGRHSTLIEYGLDQRELKSNIADLELPRQYDLVVARFEPENHIEEILEAYEKCPWLNVVIVANVDTKLFRKLEFRLAEMRNVIFLGPIYAKESLDVLRRDCRYYIHGHSVGGTNPSLVEAMGAGCMILSHKNQFNENVLNDYGFYWKNIDDLIELISLDLSRKFTKEIQVGYSVSRFDWKVIGLKHLKLFEKVLQSK